MHIPPLVPDPIDGSDDDTRADTKDFEERPIGIPPLEAERVEIGIGKEGGHDARVTPGRIIPSNGGVIISNPIRSSVRVRERMETRTRPVCTLEHDKDVHRTPLRHPLVLAKQPQHLVVPFCDRLAQGQEPQRVVATQFVSASATRPPAHCVTHREQGDGTLENGFAGSGDDGEHGVVGGEGECWVPS